jgi:hypothetical protein
MSQIFETRIAAIEALFNDKELYGVSIAVGGSFFPNCCVLPVHE